MQPQHEEWRNEHATNQYFDFLQHLPWHLQEQFHKGGNQTEDMWVHVLHGKKYLHENLPALLVADK